MKYWHETIAVAQRILIELIRRRRSLIFWSIFPISILLIVGFIFADRVEGLPLAQAFARATPPALVGSAFFFSCLGGAVATVVAEREQQTLKRLFISPLSGTSYFLGIFVAHSAIAIGQALIMFTLAISLGARFRGSILLCLVILLLSILAYVGLGFILGTQLARRTEDVNSLVAAFGVPLLILGGAFFPTFLFPEALLRIASINPIYHMTEALFAVIIDGRGINAIADHFRFLLIFAMLMVGGGWLSYRRMLQVERQL